MILWSTHSIIFHDQCIPKLHCYNLNRISTIIVSMCFTLHEWDIWDLPRFDNWLSRLITVSIRVTLNVCFTRRTKIFHNYSNANATLLVTYAESRNRRTSIVMNQKSTNNVVRNRSKRVIVGASRPNKLKKEEKKNTWDRSIEKTEGWKYVGCGLGGRGQGRRVYTIRLIRANYAWKFHSDGSICRAHRLYREPEKALIA